MKRFVWWTLGLLGGGLLLCALLVFVVDPFQAYRAASFYVPVFDSQVQAYSNAGIARHYDYDTLVLGSSMSENFSTTQIDRLYGGRSIKATFSGGMARHHHEVLRLAFDTHAVKRVFYSLDMYSFVRDPDYSPFAFPEYLYNENPFDDVNYLLNHEVAFGRVGSAIKQNLGKDAPTALDRDRMYYWGDNYTYGEKQLMASWDFATPIKEMEDADSRAAQVTANWELYLRPHIEAHPETEFIFFFPPYSSLQWYIMLAEGHLEFVQWTKEALTEWLLAYDNVKLYDFSAYTSWIEDFSLYKDYSHYKPEVNDAMVEKMAAGEQRVEDIYDVYENDELLYELAETFPVPY